MPDSVPAFVGASEDTLTVSLPAWALTVRLLDAAWTWTVSLPVPLLTVVLVADAVPATVTVLPPPPSHTFTAPTSHSRPRLPPLPKAVEVSAVPLSVLVL